MKFNDLREFGRLAPDKLAQQAKTLRAAVVSKMADAALPIAKAIAPVGGVTTKDKHPGMLKKSITKIIEGGIPHIVTDVPHGNIIDRGRRRGVTPKGEKRVRSKRGQKLKPNKKAKMLGSIQARRGIGRPTRDMLRKNFERYANEAIREIEGGE